MATLVNVAKRYSSASSASASSLEYLLLERKGRVGIVRLNRPNQLNALCQGLMNELARVLKELEEDDQIRVVVLTGNDKAFAAGADIKEMQSRNMLDNYSSNFLADWTSVSGMRKPVIAAVNGYALGGGCELAMMCDIIYAGENARFGQPEIKLGTIPGAGGTQRLTHAIGKYKAMEWILSGQQYTAQQAEHAGLVTRICKVEETLSQSVQLAEKIAEHSMPILQMCKEAVNKTYEMTLSEGLSFERRLFHTTFGTHDQKEGMSAFIEKRTPHFKNT